MAHDSRDDHDPIEAGRKDDLAPIEAALSQLTPRAAKLSAARIMFLAGQESAARAGRPPLAWLWPAVAAVSTVAAAVFGVLFAMQPGPRTVERIVYLDRPVQEKRNDRVAEAPPSAVPSNDMASTTPLPPIPTPHYLQARNQAMSQGIDSLPTLSSGEGRVEVRPVTYRELQHRILEGDYSARPKLPEPGFYSWPGIIFRGGGI